MSKTTRYVKYVLDDSLVEKIMKTMPRGKGEWENYDKTYGFLMEAASYLARKAHLSVDHIYTMAVAGTGHESMMKEWLEQCIKFGYVRKVIK